MPLNNSVNNHPATAVRPPVTVWILTALMGAMAFVSVVGSFLFAFPMGGLLGYIIGTLLIIFGIGYATIAWRLRRGERALWIAALVLPIVHTLTLNTTDLVLYGAIPSEDYPIMAVALVILVLLLLPTTRRFFTK
jgi:hypothetical protein